MWLSFHCIGHGQTDEDTLISQDRITVFKMETLLAATGNFHDDNKLGDGGFGSVYKVTYANKASTSLYNLKAFTSL
jgi:hypothetical protein